ncbi:MAG: chromate efflux transporter [Gammaproteobacteria bacterium]|nr:chromate efflux transporter [Gammaproteobacteria bacterium]
MNTETTEAMSTISFRSALKVWLHIGLLSVGGPAAQIALMHRILVDEKKWLTENQYLHALNFCMLLPGPEAMQLATYAGWRLHGVVGGLAAGLSFVLPGALVVAVLAGIYMSLGDVALVQGLFLGVKAVVLVIVLEALIRISRRALKGAQHYVIAALAFIGIFFLSVPYPLIIALAALYGFWVYHDTDSDLPTVSLPATAGTETLKTVLTWLLIWSLPVAVLWLLGANELLINIATFFSKLAVVTFGGAYAVLAYMAQDVVTEHGWLSAGQMMDGLGLAETTPGPLILVTEFVGFVAGYQAGGWSLAIGAAAVTLWVTFVPCFLWIFAGAPYIEWLGSQPRLRGALAAITAAVVGVIVNLSIWFGLHVLFREIEPIDAGLITLWKISLTSINWVTLALTIVAAIMLLRLHINVLWVLLVAAVAGMVFTLAGV